MAKLHVDYDGQQKYAATIDSGAGRLKPTDYRVDKMRFGKSGGAKDRTVVEYNERITIRGIPEDAYEYIVNGKSAIEWVMERQGVRTDKDNGIVNDSNDWAVETMHNPRYPLELLLRVITVSLETMKIVKGLPHLNI